LEIEFFLPLEPFSINAVYYRDRRHKTQAYRDWELSIFQCLNAPDIQQQLSDLRKAYDENKHCFSVDFTFYFPNLLNKSGKISSRVEDLSNVEKVLLDVLFLPKFHVQDFPFGCKNINADDKYVLSLTSKKKLGPKPGINVKVALVDYPVLEPV